MRRSDVLLPLLLGAVGTVEMVVQAYRPLPVALGTFWLAALLLVVRRTYPLAMPVAVFGVYAVTPLVGFDVSEPAAWVLVMVVASMAAGLHVPRVRALLGLASVAAACAIGIATLAFLTEFTPDVMFGALVTVGPWLLGVGLREALERNGELAAEAERARLEQALAAERGAAAERERIARELHDVLAHSLSLMVVQASLAEDLLARDAGAAAAAIREVQQSGRGALGEAGRLLRLVRDDTGELGMQPQHGITDIPALAQEFVRAGLYVEVNVEPNARDVQAGIALSAYRIVQEALTNALKHAPGSRVTVRVARSSEGLGIEVQNGPAVADEPRVGGGGVGGGHGLVGIRERVSLFGGTLSTGRTRDGGFRVAATLPTVPEAT